MMYRNIGYLIKELRIEKHMTQMELADIADVNYNTIASIEECKRIGNYATIIKILNALGYDIQIVPL